MTESLMTTGVLVFDMSGYGLPERGVFPPMAACEASKRMAQHCLEIRTVLPKNAPPMSKQTFLAVDLGAGSGRVMAAIHADGKLSLEELHRFDNPGTDLPGGSFWNLIGLYRDIIEGLRKGVEAHGDTILSIGIDTWGCDFGFLTRDDV